MMADRSPHLSVMLTEVLSALDLKDHMKVTDGTFGWGGYSEAALKQAEITLYAIDRDPSVRPRAEELRSQYKERFQFIEGRFADMEKLLADRGIAQVDAVMLDIGVSSMQLDLADRGFSFMANGPLDMRMGTDGLSAADVVNTASEDLLARILMVYGEERRARAIARAISAARTQGAIETTGALSDIIQKVLGRPRPDKIHPSTRTFQALRIFVNDELGELAEALVAAERLLAPEGRLVVVAFHSLEDRIVKNFLQERSSATPAGSRHMPEVAQGHAPTFELLFRKPQTAGEAEIAVNPRARSAKLRAARRNDVSAGPAFQLTDRFPRIGEVRL